MEEYNEYQIGRIIIKVPTHSSINWLIGIGKFKFIAQLLERLDKRAKKIEINQ